MTVRLEDDQLVELAELVAARVVELGASRPSPELVDAAAVATHLGVERDWVYRNAARLGARRVGGGRRPRLRFDLAEVDRRLVSCSEVRESDASPEPVAEPVRPRRRRARLGTSVPLLPVRGARPAA